MQEARGRPKTNITPPPFCALCIQNNSDTLQFTCRHYSRCASSRASLLAQNNLTRGEKTHVPKPRRGKTFLVVRSLACSPLCLLPLCPQTSWLQTRANASQAMQIAIARVHANRTDYAPRFVWPAAPRRHGLLRRLGTQTSTACSSVVRLCL